jgi:hypothetical protein
VNDLSWWLKNFKRSAFRLEAQQEFLVPQETTMLAAFKRGEEVQISEHHPWPRLLRQHTAQGRIVERVRVVVPPLCDYVRFELSLYPYSAAAGEQIRILETSRVFPHSDWWLFDDDILVRLKYDDGGVFLGGEMVDSASLVERYIGMRFRALENSIPLADYTARAARQ